MKFQPPLPFLILLTGWFAQTAHAQPPTSETRTYQTKTDILYRSGSDLGPFGKLVSDLRLDCVIPFWQDVGEVDR